MLLLGEGSEATEPYNKYANLFKYMLIDQFDQPIWSTLLSPMWPTPYCRPNGWWRSVPDPFGCRIWPQFLLCPAAPWGRLCPHIAKRGRTRAKTWRERRSRSDHSGSCSLRRWGRPCIHCILSHHRNILTSSKPIKVYRKEQYLDHYFLTST